MNTLTEPNTKAHRLARQITQDIQNGKFASGVLLPPDGELAACYDVSRITLRKSLSILSEKGQLRRLPYGGALATRTGDSVSESEAESLKTAKKLTLGLVHSGRPNYTVTQRLVGAKRYAEEQQIKIMQFLSSNHEETLDILSRVEDYELDGVVTSPYPDNRYLTVLKALSDKKFPLVLQNYLDTLPISSVMNNDGIAAYQATHYLIDKYHRPVYYVCPPAETEIALDRHQGYIEAMRDAGMEGSIESHTWRMKIPMNDPAYWSSEKNWLPGFYAADELLSKIEFPASIFCENDLTARGVYEAVQKHGLTIGKDVCVVGFGDYPLARQIQPAMTTCSAVVEDLGYEEVRLLHRLIRKEVQPPVHIRLPMDLTIRESA